MREFPFTNLHVPLWRNPKRQQIIIFKPPFDPTQPDYVKRAIGLPGDTIDIHDNAVWINGKKLLEDYTLGKTERVENSEYQNAVQSSGQLLFCDGRQPAEFLRFAFLGLRAAQRYYRYAGADLHVAGRLRGSLEARPNPRKIFGVLEWNHPPEHRAVEAVVSHFLADAAEEFTA